MTNLPLFSRNLLVSSAVVADLNGDGSADLAVVTANEGHSPTMLVLLSDKNGMFGSPVFVSLPEPDTGTAMQPYSLAVGALTGSGFPDIVAVDEYGLNQFLVETLLSDGLGRFTSRPVQTFSIPSGESQSSFSRLTPRVVDLDNNGKPDVVVARYSGGPFDEYVDLFAGNGDGSFQSPKTLQSFLPSKLGGSSGLAFVVESLRGDAARPDFILDNGSEICVSLNNGDGTFAAPSQVVQSEGTTDILLADLNGDSNPDLITVGWGSLETFAGNGDGTFSKVTGTAVAFGHSGFTVMNPYTVVADFNGDGKVDFASGDTYGDVEVGFGEGNGSFAATPMLHSAGPPTVLPAAISAETAADLNGDGIADVLAVGPSSILAAIADGKSGFTYKTALPASAYSVQFIEAATGDFNGDGRQDVIFVGGEGTAAVALSNGDGTLKTPVGIIKPPITLACNLGNAAVGDVDEDGKLDIVFVYTGDHNCGRGTAVPSGYLVVKGNGDGTFRTPVFHADGSTLDLVMLGRFRGKNKPLDLVLGDYGFPSEQSIGVNLLPGNGDGTFGAADVVSSGYQASQILTDDFNQDGNPDLTIIAENTLKTGGALLYAGNGDGTFATATVLGAGIIDQAGLYADLNGDGTPDLVGVGQNHKLSVYLGTGKGSFAAPVDYFDSSVGTTLLAGNFLGDNTQSVVAGGGLLEGAAFFMNQAGTSLTVAPSSSTVASGQTISLAARLAATLSGRPAPTGTITFFDGSKSIGSSPVGTPLAAVNLAVGTHQIRASYSGDVNFNPNTSTAVTVTVQAATPDFTIKTAASTLNVNQGTSGTVSLTVTASGNLNGSVTFQCSGLPSGATCAFAPASLSVVAGKAASDTLTIGTAAASANLHPAGNGKSYTALGGGAAMAVLLFAFCPRRRNAWMLLATVLVLAGALAGMMTLSGCGGGSSGSHLPSNPGTPTGTATVTITATAIDGSTTVSHSTTVALSVH